jgi:transposase
VSDAELLPKSKAEPVRRIEVFTGAGRRRGAESYDGGETVSAVARRYALTPQQLFAWRRNVRRELPGESGASGLGFAPVVVEAAGVAEASEVRLCGSAAIEIAIGAVKVRVPCGADAATLTMVLGVLGAAR